MSTALLSFYVNRWAEVLSSKGPTAYLEIVRDDVVSAITDEERVQSQRQAFALVLQLIVPSADQQQELLAMIDSGIGRQLSTQAANTDELRTLREQQQHLLQKRKQAAAALGGCADTLAQLEELRALKKNLEASIRINRERLAIAQRSCYELEAILSTDRPDQGRRLVSEEVTRLISQDTDADRTVSTPSTRGESHERHS
jgi:hypothetical protein